MNISFILDPYSPFPPCTHASKFTFLQDIFRKRKDFFGFSWVMLPEIASSIYHTPCPPNMAPSSTSHVWNPYPSSLDVGYFFQDPTSDCRTGHTLFNALSPRSLSYHIGSFRLSWSVIYSNHWEIIMLGGRILLEAMLYLLQLSFPMFHDKITKELNASSEVQL